MIIALVAGCVIDRFWWIGVVGSVPRSIRIVVGVPALLIGILYIWFAHVSFRRAGTAFQPWRSSTALAMSGIYAHTRNPMYQGAMLMGIAGAISMRSDWSFILFVPAFFLIHRCVVLREEKYLEGKFGDGYRAYRAKVLRYGLPFGMG